MKLQVALDTLALQQAIELVEEIKDEIDVVEVGTPFIEREGIRPVTELKKRFPQLEILADVKIMDAGEMEADIAFEAGADIVTVMAVTNESTIVGTLKSAKKHGKKVMVDMMNCSDLSRQGKHLSELGVDYLCVHTAFDQQSTDDPVADLHTLCQAIEPSKAAVAGGVGLKTIGLVAQEKPGIIICGGSITNATDKKKIAKQLKSYLGD